MSWSLVVFEPPPSQFTFYSNINTINLPKSQFSPFTQLQTRHPKIMIPGWNSWGLRWLLLDEPRMFTSLPLQTKQESDDVFLALQNKEISLQWHHQRIQRLDYWKGDSCSNQMSIFKGLVAQSRHQDILDLCDMFSCTKISWSIIIESGRLISGIERYESQLRFDRCKLRERGSGTNVIWMKEAT